METCRICLAVAAVQLPVSAAPLRTYFYCRNCEGVFVAPDQHLDFSKEKAFYGLHENSPFDSRYQNYLAPVLNLAWSGFVAREGTELPRALDFGSGPLSLDEESFVCVFFREKGFEVDAYDPYFRPMVLRQRQYDVIVACEVVEHFRDPASDFSTVVELLGETGILAIQTEFFPGLKRFDSWYYRRDPTHVTFYSAKTFAVLAERLGLDVVQEEVGKRVLLRRS